MTDSNISYPYFDMLDKDGTNMNFEHWEDVRSVEMHWHDYDELLIVEKGSCRHYYNGTETLLIPGDCVLIQPNHAHGYSVEGAISLFNCQYHREAVDPDVLLFNTEGGLMEQLEESIRIEKEGTLENREPENRKSDRKADEQTDRKTKRESFYRNGHMELSGYEANSEKQGVIHAEPEQLSYIISLIHRILGYQEEITEYTAIEKKKYMEIILMEFQRIQRKQTSAASVHSTESQMAVAAVLAYLDQNIAEPLNLNELAAQYGFATNYFRKIFRDVTGFPPVKYLNRLRVIRASEYILNEGYCMKDAAAEVGIYDVNYFSRLFKQIMGFAPSKL
ncbi:MAG: AraC family transcriptional regulator [Lachnospiraceae bacterium]|nr:AraC family transcriptional regulator [Lachnospiraceae bacterium]